MWYEERANERDERERDRATTSVLRRNDFDTLLPRVPSFNVSQISPRDLQRREQSEYRVLAAITTVCDRAPIDFPVNVVGHLVRRDGRCVRRAHDGQKNSKRH
jgi:hypothetical protein